MESLPRSAWSAGQPLSRRYVARGTATADFLNNGSEDLLVTVLDGSPVLLRNQSARKGHWLRIKTVGKKSNRDGFGARVEVTAGGLKQSAEVRANSSFESASDPRLHFGLGAATQVDSITVRWPSGSVDQIARQEADQELVIEEGAGVVGRRGPEAAESELRERRRRSPSASANRYNKISQHYRANLADLPDNLPNSGVLSGNVYSSP